MTAPAKLQRAPAAPSSAPRLRLLLAVALAALAIVTIVGAWTLGTIRGSIAEDVERELSALIEADAKALELWAENEIDLVTTWASSPVLLGHARALLAAADSPAEALRARPEQRQIGELLERLMTRHDSLAYGIIATGGLVLAAGDPEMIGKRTNAAGTTALAGVFDGASVFGHPAQRGSLLSGVPKGEGYRFFVAAPIRSSAERVELALALAIDPAADFSRAIAVGRSSHDTAVYAFDKSGLMLSNDPARTAEMRSLGLLKESSPILAVRVADPGVDLTASLEPAPIVATEHELTRAVRAAIAPGAGSDLDGYRDYRGVEVVGAWRWLPAFDLGLVLEVPVARAFASMRPLWFAFGTLFGLLALAILGLVINYAIVLRLQDRVGQARQLGQYALLDKIGEGGMGEVWVARHEMLRRPTAVKLLAPTAGAERTTRFEREVRATSELTHPNTISIFDYGRTEDGTFYYAMECLAGITVARLITICGSVPPARVVHILRQIAASLAEAHDRGLVHRDVKPGNVFLCERGGQFDFVKVLDFGLVKSVARRPGDDLTAEDLVQGTPGYISPERLRDPRDIGPHTDVYSLGVLAFRMLTGHQPFETESITELCSRTLTEPPPPPSTHVSLPPELDALVRDCMAREPRARLRDMHEVLDRLEHMRLDPPWTNRMATAWWEERPELRRAPWQNARLEATAPDPAVPDRVR